MIVGDTHFRNTAFIHYHLRQSGKYKFVRAHPPELGSLLIEGKVDVAPASSIIYAKNPRLYILPDFSISSQSSTGSILLFSSKIKKWGDLDGSSIATPYTSASSVAMLDILLKEHGLEVKMHRGREPSIEEMLQNFDACLLIGDHALRSYIKHKKLVLADLGEVWSRTFGSGMVYALWLCSKRDMDEFYSDLKLSKEHAMNNFSRVVMEIAQDIDVEFLAEHLQSLRFDLGEEEMEWLRNYFTLAEKHGIIDKKPELRFAEV